MEKYKPMWKRADIAFILFCSVFLYMHLFVFPAVPIFYEDDHLIFLNDAWRMLSGEAIYRDFFQFTFPGTQVLYLILFYVFGTKFWLVNAVILLQGVAQTVLCLSISKQIFVSRWVSYLPPSLYLFFGFRWFGIDGSHRMLSPIFIWLAIWILIESRSYKRIFLAGISCAVSSFFTQQRGILAVAALGVFLVVEAFSQRSGWKRILTEELILGGSFVATLSVLLLPFILTSGLDRFIEYTVVYIRYYVQDSRMNNYGAFLTNFSIVLRQGIVMSAAMCFYYALIPLGYIVGFFYLWRRKYQSSVLLVCVVGLFLALGTFAPAPVRMFQIAIPAVIIFVWLLSQSKIISSTHVGIAVILLMIFGGFSAVRLQTNWEKQYLDSPTGNIVFLSPVEMERYQWLNENTKVGEYVFEAYQSAVNFPLQVPNPTPITFVWDNGFSPVWQVRQVIDGLELKKAKYIIWDGNYSKESSERLPGDNLAPLYDYLRQHYDFDRSFTNYANRKMQAWKRKTDQ
jgi:hypothetical protein